MRLAAGQDRGAVRVGGGGHRQGQAGVVGHGVGVGEDPVELLGGQIGHQGRHLLVLRAGCASRAAR